MVKRQRVAKSGFSSGKQASDAGQEMLYRHRAGKVSAGPAVTVGEWLRSWLALRVEREDLHDGTIADDRDIPPQVPDPTTGPAGPRAGPWHPHHERIRRHAGRTVGRVAPKRRSSRHYLVTVSPHLRGGRRICGDRGGADVQWM